MIHPDFEDWTRYAMVAITTRNVPIPRLGFGTFRIPLLFDAMVANGRLGLRKIIEITATAPARLVV